MLLYYQQLNHEIAA